MYIFEFAYMFLKNDLLLLTELRRSCWLARLDWLVLMEVIPYAFLFVAKYVLYKFSYGEYEYAVKLYVIASAHGF